MHAPILGSAGRRSKDYFTAMTVKNKLLPRTLDSVINFLFFFISKLAQLHDNIATKLNSLQTLHLPSDPLHTGQPFDTIPLVSVLEVDKLLQSIPSKTSKMDFVPTYLLKLCHSVFSELIAKLCNLSFQEGCFPESFKIAQVTPLIKKPNLDPNNLSNYRPISNLNNISKILERLFMSRLQPHVLASGNFNPFQSAYRRNHSTETALLCTLDNVFNSSDQGKSTLLVSLDLSSAFDTIDHAVLKTRLQASFGVTGTALCWLTSYLCNRTQVVKLGNISSSPQFCKSVNQGFRRALSSDLCSSLSIYLQLHLSSPILASTSINMLMTLNCTSQFPIPLLLLTCALWNLVYLFCPAGFS